MSNKAFLYGSLSIVEDNLFLNWNFANPLCYSGAGADVDDLTANNNDGTQMNAIFNNPWFDFDGTSRVFMPFGSDNFNFLNSFTLQGWFKFDKADLSEAGYIIAHWTGTTATQKYRILVNQNGIVVFTIRRSDNTAIQIVITTDYGDDVKHFFSAKWDGSNNITLTIDNSETVTVSGATSILDDSSGNTEYRLGENDLGGNRYTGGIGWNLVYTDELTASEEQQNYNATKPTFI